jgi:ABC-type Fe3+-siderophore transport system permease subunit
MGDKSLNIIGMKKFSDIMTLIGYHIISAVFCTVIYMGFAKTNTELCITALLIAGFIFGLVSYAIISTYIEYRRQ